MHFPKLMSLTRVTRCCLRRKVTLDAIPVYYRGGSILPLRERPRRSTATQLADPYTLVLALDDKGEATGSLYVDDGRSFAFQKGQYLHRCVTDGVN